jgi:hypothetical protein
MAEVCDGTTGMCPPDRYVPDGSPCSDGMTCNGTETCRMGECAPGAPPNCDDGNPCTTDACMEPGGCVSMRSAAAA